MNAESLSRHFFPLYSQGFNVSRLVKFLPFRSWNCGSERLTVNGQW